MVDVVVMLKRADGEITKLECTCSYTDLRDGFLQLAWIDPGKIKVEVYPAVNIVTATLRSMPKFSEPAKKVTTVNVWTMRLEEPITEKFVCDSADFYGGFLIISTLEFEDGKAYTKQILIPACVISFVSIESVNC